MNVAAVGRTFGFAKPRMAGHVVLWGSSYTCRVKRRQREAREATAR